MDPETGMYEIEIATGLAWLDVNRPGWRTQITEPLDMQNMCYCVLGQTGGYDSALRTAVPGENTEDVWVARDLWADTHGFRIPDSVKAYDDAYEQLTTKWLERLR